MKKPYTLREWRLAQERDRWIFSLIAGMILCLLIFVISGGCR